MGEPLDRFFAFVDIALAQLLLGTIESEDVHCFIAYLSMATRQGHLCIQVDDEALSPQVEDIFKQEEAEQSLSPEEMLQMAARIMRGASQISSSLISFVHSSSTMPLTPLCRDGKRYYLQRYWTLETSCLQYLSQRLQASPSYVIDHDFASRYVQELAAQKLLLPEQAQAILQGCNRSLSILCGGPGTGKTYTAAHWIALYWNSLPSAQRRRTEVALAAPTGKAAANLQKSLSKVMGTLEEFPAVQAKTLHALLGVSSYDPAPVTADLILVDESSMIDVALMETLLKAVKPGARLILLGDPYQLPPVEAGGVFKDIVATLRHCPGHQPAELQTCLRMESRALVDLAQAIRDGRDGWHLPTVDWDAMGTTTQQRQQALVKEMLRHFIIPADALHHPQKIFDRFNCFRLLSPLRKGPYGVDALNEHFKQAASRQGMYAIPIMVTRNTPELDLYNGDVGVLVQPPEGSEGSYALFESSSKGEVRKMSAMLLPPYEYAYCLSVHKSQGSEFDHVVLLMPEGAEVFGREVLYTAVTRAKKTLEIWSSGQVLQKTLCHPMQRLSGLADRLLQFISG